MEAWGKSKVARPPRGALFGSSGRDRIRGSSTGLMKRALSVCTRKRKQVTCARVGPRNEAHSGDSS